jgi:hypothetical protein
VADVVGQHHFEMSPGDDEEVVEAISRTVRTNGSAKAFARGDATGVRIASMPTEASTASKLAVNCVSVADCRAGTGGGSVSGMAAVVSAQRAVRRSGTRVPFRVRYRRQAPNGCAAAVQSAARGSGVS